MVIMRMLILGGSWFLGRTIVEQAIERGWQVTTFSRGGSGRSVTGAEIVHGDRTVADDVARLARSRAWDVVVDTSGQEPATVLASARELVGRADRYVYVSTVNIYQGWPAEPLSDDSPLLDSRPDLRAETREATQGLAGAATYGVMKAGCEQAVTSTFGPGRALLLRPGVLLGPYEYVGRLPWLLRRMERGGRVLAAGDPARSIQPVDVRDLAQFTLDAIERGLTGAMNTAAPIGHTTYGELLETCKRVTGGTAELVWVDDGWLAAQDVRQWSEIPLWRTSAGAWAVSSPRAEDAGLVCRPLAATVADTWEWLQGEDLMPHGRQAEIGIDPAKERALLASWDATQAN